jgi:phosphoglycerol transferase MdoB-like AlkP superfamily enzyme
MLRKTLDHIPPFFKTAVKLFLLEFFILTFCRFVFYFGFKTPDVSAVEAATILKAFRMGLEFDMVASTYAMLLPSALLLINEFLYRKTLVFSKLALFFTMIIFWLYAFISSADFPYYKQFASHLNKQALAWTASPGFMLKLIFGNIGYYGYLSLFVVFAVVIYRVVKKIFAVHLAELKNNEYKPLKTALFGVLLVPFLIVGARGRLSSKSTTHEGLSIVSDNLFVNQVALNPNFTLFRSLLFQKVKDYKVPDNINECIAFAKTYLHSDSKDPLSVSREQKADSAFKNYNVVIVCMESMSSYKMGIHGREALTPNFNALVKESVYFDRFFSSGIHTFNGLFSTCSGYPSMLTDHGLRRYTKQPFTTLGNLLLQKNYNTFFLSTHDPHFDNMEGFFTQNGYKNTFSAFDLPKEKTISVTGVADHEIYKLFTEKINERSANTPFLGFIMTGSDHGPWVIPTDIPFKPNADTEEKRATQYADWAIGEFMKEVKKQPWYNNTLFVFLGDHGYYLEGTYEMPLSYHHIPFVIHKPNTFAPDTNHNLGYQPDVVSTVAGILNLSFTNNTFGSNILKEKHPFVYFTADDKIGCISDDGYFFYDLITQKTKRLRKFQNLDQEDYYSSNKMKADSLERSAKYMLNAAEYFIRKNYFSY